MTNPAALPHSIVLTGLESVGKTSLFRRMTGDKTGREANFRGSTVFCRSARTVTHGIELTDTPGIRFDADSMTTQLALDAYQHGDVVALTVRLTHLKKDLNDLLSRLDLDGKRVFLAITHCDFQPELGKKASDLIETVLRIPAVSLNARELSADDQDLFFEAALLAPRWKAELWEKFDLGLLPDLESRQRKGDTPWVITLASLIAVVSLFGVPVYLSYLFSDWSQTRIDAALIQPLILSMKWLPPFVFDFFFGSYGVVTLGWYSFLWAFPTVLAVGLSLAISEETGLAEILTSRLDPVLRRIGLSGRDLIPVLTGFGCNVSAVFQSRSCSRCHRSACVSMISFASACSYQIGTSLSIFGTAHRPALFLPYLVTLFLIGALHTRFWNSSAIQASSRRLSEPTFLQTPTWEGVWFRIRSVVGRFLGKAMPIFLLICAVSTFLSTAGTLDFLVRLLETPLRVLGIPSSAAPAVVFSFLRKDGLLVLNQSEGALLESWTAGQVFLLVFLASTLSPCLVTLFTIGKEMRVREALTIAYRQALTSLVSVGCLAAAFRLIGI